MLEALRILFESIVDRIQDKLNDVTTDIGRIQRPQEDENTQPDVLTQHEIRITILALSLGPPNDAIHQIQSRLISRLPEANRYHPSYFHKLSDEILHHIFTYSVESANDRQGIPREFMTLSRDNRRFRSVVMCLHWRTCLSAQRGVDRSGADAEREEESLSLRRVDSDVFADSNGSEEKNGCAKQDQDGSAQERVEVYSDSDSDTGTDTD